jgi:hypothetical protein
MVVPGLVQQKSRNFNPASSTHDNENKSFQCDEDTRSAVPRMSPVVGTGLKQQLSCRKEHKERKEGTWERDSLHRPSDRASFPNRLRFFEFFEFSDTELGTLNFEPRTLKGHANQPKATSMRPQSHLKAC